MNVNLENMTKSKFSEECRNVIVSSNEQLSSTSKRKTSSTSSINSRGTWGSKWEFLLSCVGLSVGIGNVWRFPYLAYDNGGGAFLIPYIIMLFLAGKPMYFMELALGQYSGKSPLTVWSCVPIAKGVGFGMMTVTLIISIYYNVIMAYTLFYMASTFQSVLPWANCNQEWAIGTNCTERSRASNFTERRTTPTQLYWERYVLDTTESLTDLGGIKWDLCLCLLVGWTVVALCILKGIKTSGKVVYVAATFPYVILTILLICGVMQEGSEKGLLYLITPQWEKLTDIQVWQNAAGQMFFSLSLSMGALISYSSYNNFRNNVFRDAMIVSILDTLTSIIASLVIFSVLGAMAHDLNVDVSEVASSGFGLAFVAYPEALSPLPVPQLWCFLFFFMFFILGLDSEFALLESILTSFTDEFPILRKYREIFVISSSLSCFLLGLPCVTRGGQYILEIMNDYGGGISVIFVAIFECIAIGWIYGTKRFCSDIEKMLGFRPSWYWRITWLLTSPLILAFVFIYSVITHEPIHKRMHGYPVWANAIGWCLAALPMIQIFLWAIITIMQQNGQTFIEKLKKSITPTTEWKPNDPTLQEAKENPLNNCVESGVENYAFSVHL